MAFLIGFKSKLKGKVMHVELNSATGQIHVVDGNFRRSGRRPDGPSRGRTIELTLGYKFGWSLYEVCESGSGWQSQDIRDYTTAYLQFIQMVDYFTCRRDQVTISLDGKCATAQINGGA